VNAFRALQEAASAADEDEIVNVEEESGLEVPDVGPPVVSSIDIDRQGTINDLRIAVDISHTYIGDLRVDLIAPNGTAVALHNNTGGSANDLVKTYSVDEFPALRTLLGKPIGGTWQLRVRDTFGFDVGRLNRWRIMARITATTPAPLTARLNQQKVSAKRSRKDTAAKRSRQYS
jgi:subtilisin-like proprotein convertase family protein